MQIESVAYEVCVFSQYLLVTVEALQVRFD